MCTRTRRFGRASPRALSLAVAGVVLLAACQAERGGAAVEVDGPSRFLLEEELRIDGHAEQLVPIDTTIRVAVARDGMIAIVQQQESRVRFFSPTGENIGSIGGRGQGPGEFENAWRLGWIADTLYVYDFSLRRFSLIDPQLRYVRYVHVPIGARPSPELAGQLPSFGVVFGGALYADGSVYGQLAQPTSAQTGAFDPLQTTYGRVAEDGTILSYFQFPTGVTSSMTVSLPQGSGQMATNLFPAPERPILRLSDDGTRMAHLTVSMEGPEAGTYEILMEDVFEGELYRRRYPFEQRPITPALRDSLIEDWVTRLPPEVASAFRRNATVTPMLPPVVAMVAGRDGTLWIRLSDTAEGRPYRILDPEGEPIGSLLLPHHSRVAVADRNHVWVIEKDEVDVESLVRYRLRAAGS